MPIFVSAVTENTGVTQSRVAAAFAELDAALAAASGPGVSEDEALAALREYGAGVRRLEYRGVELIAGLDQRAVFASRGYRSTIDAIADLLGWDRSRAARRIRAGQAVTEQTTLDGQRLAPKLPATAAAFKAGRLDLTRVEVVNTALRSGPARRLQPSDWEVAEQRLAEFGAAGARPSQLRDFAGRLLELLDQDGKRPDADRPDEPGWLRLTSDPAGGGYLRGRLDASGFAAVATAIDALSGPAPDVPASLPQRQSAALVEVCEFALKAGTLPHNGGRPPQLNITVTLAELEALARGAWLDYGGKLRPPELRMLACEAQVIPIVLGGQGQPLDVGRAKRTPTVSIRAAVQARDQGCAFPGCGRPPAWCDTHHLQHWADGGSTRVDNLVMLCRAHHRLCHHSGWQVRIRDGTPEFVPPNWLDPSRKPRRKTADDARRALVS